MKTIYVVGNLLLEEDNIPLRILPQLRKQFTKILFKELDPSEDMPEEKNLIIIDTAADINDVRILSDIDSIVTDKNISLHDFDLGATLKLMKKAGKIKDVTIICVPMGMNEEEAIKRVSMQIKRLLP